MTAPDRFERTDFVHKNKSLGGLERLRVRLEAEHRARGSGLCVATLQATSSWTSAFSIWTQKSANVFVRTGQCDDQRGVAAKGGPRTCALFTSSERRAPVAASHCRRTAAHPGDPPACTVLPHCTHEQRKALVVMTSLGSSRVHVRVGAARRGPRAELSSAVAFIELTPLW